MNKGYLWTDAHEELKKKKKKNRKDTNSRDQKNIRFKLTLVNRNKGTKDLDKSLSLSL